MIRTFRDEDTKELIDLWYRASLIAHPFLSEPFLEDERSQIIDQWVPIAETTVYELDGQVVGFLSLIGTEVGGFFVDPDHQGRGIGRALMDDAKESRTFLELDVFAANSIGRRFYHSYGFEQVDSHIHDETGQLQLRLRLG